jgi:hypothetical protein
LRASVVVHFIFCTFHTPLLGFPSRNAVGREGYGVHGSDDVQACNVHLGDRHPEIESGRKLLYSSLRGWVKLPRLVFVGFATAPAGTGRAPDNVPCLGSEPRLDLSPATRRVIVSGNILGERDIFACYRPEKVVEKRAALLCGLKPLDRESQTLALRFCGLQPVKSSLGVFQLRRVAGKLLLVSVSVRR